MIKGEFKLIEQDQVLCNSMPIILKFIAELPEFKCQSVQLNEWITANFLEYETSTREERVWEAHKEHFDLHYLMAGQEWIDLDASNSLEKGEYHKEDDYYLLYGSHTESCELSAGQFMLLDLEEAHRTGINEHKTVVKKIVFKIRKTADE